MLLWPVMSRKIEMKHLAKVHFNVVQACKQTDLATLRPEARLEIAEKQVDGYCSLLK